MNERVNFQVEGRITELLGQNYSSVEHALKELIDNAWDADAENVYIHLPDSLDPKVRFITVVDDGIGMSSENIKNEYMHIARNRLVFGGDRTKNKNRKIKGRKGIGKFAGLLIANKMTVKTTQSEITTTFTLQKDSFVEATRKEGTMYCDRIFSEGRTCKQVSSKKIFNENLQSNELLSLYEKTYQAVYYKKRIAKTNKEIKRVDIFLKKLKTSRNDYRRDKISEDDFRTILAEYSADNV